VQEMVYEVNPGEGREDRGGQRREAEGGEAGDGGEERAEGIGAYGGGEVPGRVVGMDGEAQVWGGLPRVGGGLGDLAAVAGSGDGGDAPGALQPRVQVERGVALSPRLVVLLKRSQAGMMKRLDKRLKKVQGNLKAPQEERGAAAEKKL